jgi:hypothetical protein
MINCIHRRNYWILLERFFCCVICEFCACNVVALRFSFTQQLRRKALRDILMKSMYPSSYTVTHEVLNILHFIYLLYCVENYYVLYTPSVAKEMFVVNAVRCDNHPT